MTKHELLASNAVAIVSKNRLIVVSYEIRSEELNRCESELQPFLNKIEQCW